MDIVLLLILLSTVLVIMYNYKKNSIDNVEHFRNVGSCRGWRCSRIGDYCAPGKPGSTGRGGPGYCCRREANGSLKWKKGRCPQRVRSAGKCNALRTANNRLTINNRGLNKQIRRLKYKIKLLQKGSNRSNSYDDLEKQYTEKLDKINMQKTLLTRNNRLMSEHDDTIEKQKDILMNTENEIQKNRRLLVYEQKDDIQMTKLFRILKLILLLLGVSIIGYLLVNMYFKEQLDGLMNKAKSMSGMKPPAPVAPVTA